MDPLQNSALCDFRSSAGLTQVQLAAALGTSQNNISAIETGRQLRLRWGVLQRFSVTFKQITLDEAVKLFWGERRGELCPCGCGNPKAFPDADRAYQLFIAVSCGLCPKARLRRQGQRHAKLCGACLTNEKRNLASVTAKCGGYPFYGKRRFAKTCRGEVVRRRSEFKRLASANERLKTFMCLACSAALQAQLARRRNIIRGLRQASEQVKTPQQRTLFFQLTGFYHYERVPKIRSFERLAQLQRAIVKLNDHLDDRILTCGVLSKSGGNKLAPGPRTYPEGWRSAISIGRLLAGARNGRVSWVRGCCQLCGKIILSRRSRAPLVHRECYLSELSKRREHRGFFTVAALSRNRRGRVSNTENLRKHFAWLIRHKIGGESLGEIAKDFAINKQSVVDGIAAIIDRLPDEPQIPAGISVRKLLISQ